MSRLLRTRIIPRVRSLNRSQLILPLRNASTFEPHPSPPRLPADQQAEFERLQRAAATSSATQQANAQAQQPLSTSRHVTTPSPTSSTAQSAGDTPVPTDSGDADPSGGVWRGAPPEFDGDVNPSTGEVGGPKNEPLWWGAKGDWSYNGRVTDF
jgi:Protein of unknown function (DUF1674)